MALKKKTYEDDPTNLTGAFMDATGSLAATVMLERMTFWCTRPKGGVEFEGRLWSYRKQAEWIEHVRLSRNTGKRAFKLLVDKGLILKRMAQVRNMPGLMMHVAISDATYALMEAYGGTQYKAAVDKAKAQMMAYLKTQQATKVATDWQATKDDDDEVPAKISLQEIYAPVDLTEDDESEDDYPAEGVGIPLGIIITVD